MCGLPQLSYLSIPSLRRQLNKIVRQTGSRLYTQTLAYHISLLIKYTTDGSQVSQINKIKTRWADFSHSHKSGFFSGKNRHIWYT